LKQAVGGTISEKRVLEVLTRLARKIGDAPIFIALILTVNTGKLGDENKGSFVASRHSKQFKQLWKNWQGG
jgi:hypothetical protein